MGGALTRPVGAVGCVNGSLGRPPLVVLNRSEVVSVGTNDSTKILQNS